VVLGRRLEIGWVLARGRGFGLSTGVLWVCIGVCVCSCLFVLCGCVCTVAGSYPVS
jgi:hypothetical protein